MSPAAADVAVSRVLPPERLGTDADRVRFAVDDLVPRTVVFPETIDEVQAAVRAAAAAGLALVPAGCGAHLGIGMPPRRLDVVISLGRLTRLVEHAAADMTVTVEAGMTVAGLDAALAAARQWLPLDPPLPGATTVGGLIAANLNGPLRVSQGGVRDLVIGLRAVRADGSLVKGGGRVVKNVAGYDLPKAFIGSLGTLGVIVEATFKVRPRPEVEDVVVAACPSIQTAMEIVLAVRDAHVAPLWIEVAGERVIAETAAGGAHGDPDRPDRSRTDAPAPGAAGDAPHGSAGRVLVVIGLGGAEAAVAVQRERMAAIVSRTERTLIAEPEPGSARQGVRSAAPHARPVASPGDAEPAIASLSSRLRDYPATASGAALCTVSLLPGDVASFVEMLGIEANGCGFEADFVADAAVATLHVALRAALDPGDPRRGETAAAPGGIGDQRLIGLVARLRELAGERRGHLVVRHASAHVKRAAGVWGEVGQPRVLMERLKNAFDPGGLLGPGRFAGGL